MARFVLKVGQIDPEVTNPGLFQIIIQYILALRAKMFWILIWKKYLNFRPICGQSDPLWAQIWPLLLDSPTTSQTRTQQSVPCGHFSPVNHHSPLVSFPHSDVTGLAMTSHHVRGNLISGFAGIPAVCHWWRCRQIGLWLVGCPVTSRRSTVTMTSRSGRSSGG